MAGPKPRKETAPESEAQIPQSTPTSTGYPGKDYDYTLQCIFDLQRSFGSIETKLDAMKSSVDGLKTKVDDLIGWKNKILGGAASLVAIVAVLGFLVGKASDYFVIGLKPAPATPLAHSAPAPAPSKTP